MIPPQVFDRSGSQVFDPPTSELSQGSLTKTVTFKFYQFLNLNQKAHYIVLENLAIYSHNPEVRYIEFLLMDSGSELSPEQDPVVWKILNLGHFALNSAD